MSSVEARLYSGTSEPTGGADRVHESAVAKRDRMT
jgi:hypothetical protein